MPLIRLTWYLFVGSILLFTPVICAAETLPETDIPDSETYTLWIGPTFPDTPETIPVPDGIQHHTIHDARYSDYKFLHGPALTNFKGIFFAHWANSPKNENGPAETLQGRRSTDACATWSALEIIGPGFPNEERHSHGVFLEHNNELWTFASRFGIGEPGKKFTGLQAEAFVLDTDTDTWHSRGIAMDNCWPYDQPVFMDNGNFITGGQDKDGLPVVAISKGNDLTQWNTIHIPYPPALAPSFAETTVWCEKNFVLAIIRGGEGVAWVSTSQDYGKTWAQALPSNYPMPRAKAYLGKLSTGQMYLVSNYHTRDTLVLAVGRPGALTLSKLWRLRHGKSIPPRFEGHAKSKQWSYPYGYEYNGNLYVVYSIGKEDCGLSIIPVSSLSE